MQTPHQVKIALIRQKKETKSSLVNPRLKTILPLIATQLIPIQQVFTDFAIVMLNNMKTLQNRINTLAKFEQNTTVKPNATELTVDNNTTYIPKSALIKTSINVSNACALANDTKIKELRTELVGYKKDFGTKVATIFKQCAELEVKTEKAARIQTFLSYSSKLTQGFIIIEERKSTLSTDLNKTELLAWTTLMFL